MDSIGHQYIFWQKNKKKKIATKLEAIFLGGLFLPQLFAAFYWLSNFPYIFNVFIWLPDKLLQCRPG
jgi:hypothetical protein